MCGINGFTFRDRGLIEKMNAATHHRGPDGTGVFCDERVTLGHNLLAITEKPELSQGPYASGDGMMVVTYNGEIYNYVVLRERLERDGDVFTTQSDTEVLLKGLQRYGIAFARELDGMFAFAFYDKRAHKLYLVRDPGGMKPLYFSFEHGALTFSSEVRGLLESHSSVLNPDALGIFLTLGYVPGHRTLFSGIQKVRPGHILTMDLDRHTLIDGTIEAVAVVQSHQFDSGRFRDLIGQAVRAHTMGRRPYGLYLSGGLDSTMILHELAQQGGTIKTYTTRFNTEEHELNEDAALAQRLCQDYDIEHHEVVVTERNFLEVFDQTFQTIEEPRYHLSAPAYYLLAQRASQDVAVVMSGNGGDELFGGYDRYLRARDLYTRLQRFPSVVVDAAATILNLRRGTIRPHLMHMSDPLVRWAYLTKIRPRAGKYDIVDLAHALRADAQLVLGQSRQDANGIMMELDRLFWLADEEFIRTDKIAMHFGLEGRFPLLARGVVSYADGISGTEKLAGGATKVLVRKAYQNILPSYIINKPKTGWYAPTLQWLHGPLGQHVRAALDPAYYPATADLFDLRTIAHAFDRAERFTRIGVKQFMPVAIFQIWARAFHLTL